MSGSRRPYPMAQSRDCSASVQRGSTTKGYASSPTMLPTLLAA